jgi:hypothetical protein
MLAVLVQLRPASFDWILKCLKVVFTDGMHASCYHGLLGLCPFCCLQRNMLDVHILQLMLRIVSSLDSGVYFLTNVELA